MKRFLDWQIEVGVPGVIMLGTTGEFLTVSDEERSLLVETTVKHVRGRIKVMIGTMNAHTPRAVRYSREAQDLGADGLMILPPYYYTPTEDEIFNYYRAICEKVSLPIMLYNNPFTSHVDMKPKFVARLTHAFQNIRYIKEASMDVGRVYDIIEETEGVMNVFAGERIFEILCARRHRLCEPLRQLHPARLLAHLRPDRRGPARRGRAASRRSSPRSTTSSPPAIRATATNAIPRRSPPPSAIRSETSACRSPPSRSSARRARDASRR